MKNQVLFPIILSALLFFASAGNVYAFGNGGFGSPFGNDQSFGGGSPSDGRLPSDISFERITGFGTIHPAAAPPPGGNPGGGIDVGGPGGTDDDDDNRNDAPVGNGLLMLLCIAVMHTFIVMLRRKKEKLLF